MTFKRFNSSQGQDSSADNTALPSGTLVVNSSGQLRLHDGSTVGGNPVGVSTLSSLVNNGHTLSLETTGALTLPQNAAVVAPQGNFGPPDGTFDNVKFGLYGNESIYGLGIEDSHVWLSGSSGVRLYSGTTARLTADSSGIEMNTDRGTLQFGYNLEAPGVPSHFHISKSGSYDLFFGDDYNYLKLPTSGGIELNAYDSVLGSANLSMDPTGNVFLPSAGKLVQHSLTVGPFQIVDGNSFPGYSELYINESDYPNLANEFTTGDLLLDGNDSANFITLTQPPIAVGGIWILTFIDGWSLGGNPQTLRISHSNREWIFKKNGILSLAGSLTVAPKPQVGQRLSTGEPNFGYGGIRACFNTNVFTGGVFDDIRVGWIVNGPNGFQDTIAIINEFGAGFVTLATQSWPGQGPYTFSSPDYVPETSNNLNVIIDQNQWTFGKNGALTLNNGNAQIYSSSVDGSVTISDSILGESGQLPAPSTGLIIGGTESVLSFSTYSTGAASWKFYANGASKFPNNTISAPDDLGIALKSNSFSNVTCINSNLLTQHNTTSTNLQVADGYLKLSIGYLDNDDNQQYKNWVLNKNEIVFPDNTIQTTAHQKASTGWYQIADTEVALDNIKARATTGGVMQITTVANASVNGTGVSWSGLYNGQLFSQSGTNWLQAGTWQTLTLAYSIQNDIDIAVVHLLEQSAGQIYKITFANIIGRYTVVIERVT